MATTTFREPVMQRRSLLLASALVPLAVRAQGTYPVKPIRLIVGFPPGGGIDFTARAIQPGLEAALGQPVVIEYKPGAGGVIAATELSRAAPDGYTLLIANTGPFAIAPYLQARRPYDPVTQFSYVGQIAEAGYIAATRADHPAKDLGQFIEWAKANPGKANFASGGPGASTHLNGELLNSVAGIDLLHVPYKGSAPALVDVIAGNATGMFDILVTSLPQIRAGKVRALAVTSSKRSSHAPDIPTMVEAGVTGYGEAGSDLWFGVFAPAGTPRAIVDRLNAELVKALRTPEVSERIRQQAYDTWTLTPDEFAAFLRTDHAKWGQVVKLSGYKAD